MTDEALKDDRARSRHVMLGMKYAGSVHWCSRCGGAFTAGGATLIFRGDPDCHGIPMKVGPLADAIADLRAA